ncbi:MAG: hypothetical protein JXA60_09060 [Candidatus Coatesbacteria bacterium]|nr:hypothetical protein [Candidatus Coatesbacteria bacterium]
MNNRDLSDNNNKAYLNLYRLSSEILRYANLGTPRIDFLKVISRKIIDFTGCFLLEIRVSQGKKAYIFKIEKSDSFSFSFNEFESMRIDSKQYFPCITFLKDKEEFYKDLVLRKLKLNRKNISEKGTFFIEDISSCIKDIRKTYSGFEVNQDSESCIFIPFLIDKRDVGILSLFSRQKDFFRKKSIRFYEDFAESMGFSISDRRAQSALRERIKELACLYSIDEIMKKDDMNLRNKLVKTVDKISSAFQFPENLSARIVIDDYSVKSREFTESEIKLRSDISIKRQKKGYVEVFYNNKENLEGDFFLEEEKHLLNTISRAISIEFEKKQAENEKDVLYKQLLHADRLATLGQLASGVAHEINEPLGNILGFAQLAMKCPYLPEQASQDIKKIINSSLHAREIVKKLLIFARQVPIVKKEMNLNQIIEDNLFFIESRCSKEGIKLEKSLSRNLPDVVVDPSQMSQVIVNLLVNSIQAMPGGGKISISTRPFKDKVLLSIRDTGTGMTSEIQKQIFVPFFTTKETGQGTGLGLSVVHGIITNHDGVIKVISKIGSGTEFKILLPKKED